MPNPDWEDLTEFFEPSEFATLVVFTRGGGNSGEVFCIFNDPNQPATLGEYEMDLDEPHLVAPAADLAGVRKHDVATIGGVAFDVMKEAQRDGSGLATVILAVPNVMRNAGL